MPSGLTVPRLTVFTNLERFTPPCALKPLFSRPNPHNFRNFAFHFQGIPLPPAALIMYFMFAVVKIAGQQFKVQPGQTLYVPHLYGNAGDKIEFAELLLSNDGKFADGDKVKTTIKSMILGQVKGEKVIAFKMKRRKGFRKKHGHRTQYTHIKFNRYRIKQIANSSKLIFSKIINF